MFIGDPENAVSSPRIVYWRAMKCTGSVAHLSKVGAMDSNHNLPCNEGCNCVLSQNEEFITLADPKLSLFTGEEEDVDMMDVNDTPQHKITDFT